VICGNRQIWRIDPTGQFWNCHAVAMGRDADRVEQKLYERLSQEQQQRSSSEQEDLGAFLETLTADEALNLACECMEAMLRPKQPTISSGGGNSMIHWHSVILDFTTNVHKPKRSIRRGAFLPPQKDLETDKP
jgi:20S proteasome alpha/beta subunit